MNHNRVPNMEAPLPPSKHLNFISSSQQQEEPEEAQRRVEKTSATTSQPSFTGSRPKPPTLLLQLILLLHMVTLLARATSNINSVWLSKDDSSSSSSSSSQQERQESRLAPISITGNNTSQIDAPLVNTTGIAPHRRSGDWLPASTPSSNLQTASSSLLPSIVEGDAGDHLRRNDQLEEPPIYTAVNSSRRSHHHRDADGPRLLEHLWVANQTNSQVQFDENEHLTNGGGGGSSSASDAGGLAAAKSSALNSLLQALSGAGAGQSTSTSGAATAAEQLLEELATPSPLNGTSSQSASGSGESSGGAGGGSSYLSESTRNPPNSASVEPYIYYLHNGDRWNLSANTDRLLESLEHQAPVVPRRSTTSSSQNRRRLHSSGTQYDLRERERANAASGSQPTVTAPDEEEPLTTSSYPNERPSRSQSGGPQIPYDFGITSPLFDPTRAPRPQPQTQTRTQYHHHHFGHSLEPTSSSPGRRTTPIPQIAAQLYPMAEQLMSRDYLTTTSDSYLHQHQQQDLVPKQRVVGHPRHYQQHYLQQLPRRNRFPQRPANRSYAQETGARMLTPRDQHQHKLAFYTPMHRLPELVGNSRKSLLTSLSNRLNSWDSKESIENHFYDSTVHGANRPTNNKRPANQRQRQRRPRPPNNWNNFYQLDPAAFGANHHHQQQLYLPNYAAIQAPFPSGAHLQHPAAFYQPIQTAYLAGGPLAVQQPTVQSAPNQLYRFHAGGAGNPNHQVAPRRHRRVPLSATNAHYYGASSQAQASHLSSGGGGQRGSDAQNSAFIPVLAVSVSKTSPAPRPAEVGSALAADEYLAAESPPRGQQLESYGGGDDFASGSVSRDSQEVRRLLERQQLIQERRRAAQVAAAQHTTTVKSAVFGYVPHDSPANPLLRAVNIIPSAQQANYHPQRTSQLAAGGGEHFYNNQLVDQVEPSGATHYQVDPPPEEPPSLALQLQANNFVQNDIAHPFLEHQQNRKSLLGGTIDVYPANQAQYHGFQLLNADQAAYAGQTPGAIGLLNPLLAGSPDGQMRSPQMLAAAASEIDPMLPAFMYATAGRAQAANAAAAEQQVAASQPEVAFEQQVAGGALDAIGGGGGGGGAQLNDRGKKRSSEFFASAGQLLLSALPLLLAPTLGLMFASSPNQVARYHGAQPASFANVQPPAAASSSLVTASLPSSYISNGLVSNASPVPHLFTPTPPSYLLTTTVSNRPQNKTTTDQQRRNNNSTVSTTNRNKTTTSSPRITVTVTTLNPAPNAADLLNRTDGETNSTNTRKIGGHTIVLVTTDDDDSAIATNGSAPEQKVKSHYAIGYEGVDFDAQFPALRKGTMAPVVTTKPSAVPDAAEPSDRSSNNHLDGNVLNLQRHTTSKNRYQYSEVFTGGNAANKRSGQAPPTQPPLPVTLPLDNSSTTISNQEDLSSSSSRLYPVSTWPSSRRRTVQLVTSNGNKTMPDSSYKYPDLDPPLSRTKARSSKRNYTVSSVERPDSVSSNKPDEVGFVLSDGAGNFFDLVTNSEATSSRRKREVASVTTTAEPAKAPRRRKVIKVKVKGGAGGSAVKVTNLNPLESVRTINASQEQPPAERYREQMDGDASKSKSAHIITTMITHLDDEHDHDSAAGEGGSGGDDIGANELREQLLKKKVLLDKISSAANHRMYDRPAGGAWQSEDESGRHRIGTSTLADEELPEGSFSAGGRGRFPTSDSRRRKEGLVVIEDSVKMQHPNQAADEPGDEDQLQQHYNRRRRKDVHDRMRRPEESRNRFTGANSDDERYGAFEASSTERTITMTDDQTGAGQNFRPLRSNSAGNHSAGGDWRRPEAYQRPNLRQPPYQVSGALSGGGGGGGGGGVGRLRNISRPGDDYLQELQAQNVSSGLKMADGYPLRPVRDRVNLIENELTLPGDDRASSGGDYHSNNNWPPHYVSERHNGGKAGQVNVSSANFNFNSDPTSSLHGYNLYTSNHINSSMNRQVHGDRQVPMHSNERGQIQPERQASHHERQLHHLNDKQDHRYQAYNLSSTQVEQPYEQPYSNGHYGPNRQPPLPPPPQQQSPQQQQQPYNYETRYPSNHYAASSNSEGHLPAGSHYTTYAPSVYQPSISHNTYPPPIMYHNNNHKSSNQQQQQPQHYGQQTQQVNYNHNHRLEVDDYAPGYGLKVPPPDHQLISQPPNDVYEQQQQIPPPLPPPPPHKYYNQQSATEAARYSGGQVGADTSYLNGPPPPLPPIVDYHTKYTRHQHYQAPSEPAGGPQYSPAGNPLGPLGPLLPHLTSGSAVSSGAVEKASDSRAVNDYLKRAQFNDSDRDKLMASYLTCDGLLNDNDHCLERLSCEFSDPQNLEKANKLDRAVSSILLGHILINTYIPDQFKLRLKSASLFGYTQSGKCSRFVCHKLSRPSGRAA